MFILVFKHQEVILLLKCKCFERTEAHSREIHGSALFVVQISTCHHEASPRDTGRVRG